MNRPHIPQPTPEFEGRGKGVWALRPGEQLEFQHRLCPRCGFDLTQQVPDAGADQLSKRWPLVGPVGVRGSVEQPLIFVEVIPSERADVVSEPIEYMAKRCGLEDDALGYETLHDAIVGAEHVGTRVLGKVEPENLFFVFSQSMQALGETPLEMPLPQPALKECDGIDGQRHDEEGGGDDQRKPQHRAMVLCKLKHADELEKYLIGKEQECRHHPKRYQVAWRELQDLKKCLGGFSVHVERSRDDEEVRGPWDPSQFIEEPRSHEHLVPMIKRKFFEWIRHIRNSIKGA